MERLIDFHAPEVQAVLPLLLQDRSTKRNIIWATDPPEALQDMATDKSEITVPQLQQMGYEAILPRMMKQAGAQQERTRKKGEVFSPAWVCNKMNNALDMDWFGPEAAQNGPFTLELPQGWQTVAAPVPFDEKRTWKRYVDSRRLEIACGEAPFLASRYDAASGEPIRVGERIGILDRKLRVVSENAADEDEWVRWAVRALQATYGYEYQGDNLLLARTNLLLTFTEHLQARWHRPATTKELKTAANIIAWNVWQMDGLRRSVPGGKPQPEVEQMDLFSMFGAAEEQPPAVSCKVKDWRANKAQDFETIREGSTSMKFDYVIGNPPYQDETIGDNKGYAPPVYNKFLDASYEIADKVEMIHPARFLFNAGSTPKAWNEKMLNDSHFKVLEYETDASLIFPNTDIKGGVVISYRNQKKDFGAIGVFTKFLELNSILHKVIDALDFEPLSDIVITRTAYRLTDKLHEKYPEAIHQLSKGHAYDMSTNIFDRLPQVFHDTPPVDGYDYIQILGRTNNERTYKYIRRDFVNEVKNLDRFKIFIPKANGIGSFGEVISSPITAYPGTGSTETFLSIGIFDSEFEMNSAIKYIKTKFARALLGVLKTTQDITPEKWKYVPFQDFTQNSDIDWSRSIAEIDQQLYKKYGLSAEEINFIETHVKEMA